MLNYWTLTLNAAAPLKAGSETVPGGLDLSFQQAQQVVPLALTFWSAAALESRRRMAFRSRSPTFPQARSAGPTTPRSRWMLMPTVLAGTWIGLHRLRVSLTC